jgi:iron-sulfur cluster assembly accessory protein
MSVDVTEKMETIKLTEAAARTVKDLLAQKNVPDHGLRIFVSGGGCSGLQYGMALEAEARSYDHVVEAHGVKMFVDPTSMMYLGAATIDYEDSLMGGGFRVDNPNAVSTCGCGHSFKTEAQAAAAPAASNGGGGCGCG